MLVIVCPECNSDDIERTDSRIYDFFCNKCGRMFVGHRWWTVDKRGQAVDEQSGA